MITDQHPTGLYLHIPFCRHLCDYCAFAKTDKGAFSSSIQNNYLNAVELEYKFRSEHINTENLETLYMGGGTPSRLDQKNLDKLLTFLDHNIHLHKLKEITFEINPEDLIERPSLLYQLKDYGINRVSMGIQTFQENGIRILNRKTTREQNINALEYLTNNFDGRISLDLILSWPGQTIDELANDLLELSNFRIEHLSTYLLNYEPSTKLERDRKKGLIKELNEDDSADLWEYFQNYCVTQNYHHYEISSFCLEQQGSQHNIKTWEGHPYLGLGAGAVSRIDRSRWSNHKNVDKYIKLCSKNQDPKVESEYIDSQMEYEEDLLLALRYEGGLNLTQFKEKHHLDLERVLSDELIAGQENRDWIINHHHLRMTPKGWQLFDHWISEWMLKLDNIFQKPNPK